MTYIVIEGVIGVGKTALTRMLGEQFSVPTLFEQFEEIRFLANSTLTVSSMPSRPRSSSCSTAIASRSRSLSLLLRWVISLATTSSPKHACSLA